MSIVDRLRQRAANNGDMLPPDDEAPVKWPNVWELLTRTHLEGTMVRTPSNIRISLGKGEWTVTIGDEDTQQWITAVSPRLSECLDRLEHHLTSPDAVWNEWKRKGQGKHQSTTAKKSS